MSKLSERRREIRGMDLVTAEQELKTLRRQLFDLRIQKERGEVKDIRLFARTKVDIARLLYHIGELHNAERMEAEGTMVAEAAAETAEPEVEPEAATPAPRARRTRASAARAGAPETATATSSAETTDVRGPEAEEPEASGASAAPPAVAPLTAPEPPEATTGSEEEEEA